MDTESLLAITSRDVPDAPRQLLTLAARQLSLAEAALRIHDQAPFAGTAASTSGAGIHQVSGLSIAGPLPTTAQEVFEFAKALRAGPDQAELGARSFVYELAVLKRMVESAVKAASGDAAQFMREFEAACPNLINVRDSLAHLDARMLGFDRRGNPIEFTAHELAGHALAPGAVVQRGKLAVHVGDGSLAEIAVTQSVVDAARKLITGVASCFPAKPAS